MPPTPIPPLPGKRIGAADHYAKLIERLRTEGDSGMQPATT